MATNNKHGTVIKSSCSVNEPTSFSFTYIIYLHPGLSYAFTLSSFSFIFVTYRYLRLIYIEFYRLIIYLYLGLLYTFILG